MFLRGGSGREIEQETSENAKDVSVIYSKDFGTGGNRMLEFRCLDSEMEFMIYFLVVIISVKITVLLDTHQFRHNGSYQYMLI